MKYEKKIDFEAAKEYIKNSTKNSVVMIGCDSVRLQTPKGNFARYSTVIVVRRATGEGRGTMYHGCKVFDGTVTLPDYGEVIKSGKMRNLRMRLMQEVTFALEVFEEIIDVIEDRPYEIHIDINSRPECESHVALAEARGYVLGMTGKEPEFKPTALAASFAADAVAHGLLH